MPVKNPFTTISYSRLWIEVWKYAQGIRSHIAFYHVLFLFAMCFDLAIPWLFGQLINTLQAAGPNLFNDCLRFLCFIIACHFMMWVFHGPGRVIERRCAQLVFIQYITTMFSRLTELPLSWHQDHHSGSTINRIRTAATALRGFTENSFISFQRVVSLTGSLVMLTSFNPWIGLISFTGTAISLSLIVLLNRRMTQAIHEMNEAGHTANATFYDFVGNMVSIVILRLQSFSKSTLASKLQHTLPPFMREAYLNEWRFFFGTMFAIATMATILLGYIWFQLQAGHAIAAGALVTIYMYQEKVGGQMFDFIWMHGTWLNALTDLRATQHIMDDHQKLASGTATALPPTWQKLDISNLQFTYATKMNREVATLADINLKLGHGEKIALIGGSGGGKSTLLSLLRALHNPQHADVTVDGQKAGFDALSQLTTLIPQDPEIFENTIRFNVSFGLDVPDSVVLRALELAEFLPVLEQLPKGLDTDIREKGVNLSVGQKQRLALARGLFAAEQSDIILLDEPTSSVDLPTEERIFKNLFTHFKGKSVVATLHRLHLLPEFDRIIYLDKGRITSDLPSSVALTTDGPIRDIYKSYQQKEM
ncbi:MAG: msbA 1 [Alphaproteobacteria bacterium]|jgi:ABC-type multidrug transport system fused ATPase/permease subunit|nr:msbA 1 [Alphaproteobacteria bacterium]